MIYKTLSDPGRGYFLPFLTQDTFSHISIQLLTCNHLQLYNLFASTFTISLSLRLVSGLFTFSSQRHLSET